MKQLALLTVPVLLLCLSILLLRPSSPPLLLSLQTSNSDRRLNVFLSDLPHALNYGLLDLYWSLPAADSRIPASSDPDHPAPRTRPPYPNNPLIKQYSAEYWLLASLRPDSASANSSVRVVADWREADVVFVPFFATLSAWSSGGAPRARSAGRRGTTTTAANDVGNNQWFSYLEILKNLLCFVFVLASCKIGDVHLRTLVKPDLILRLLLSTGYSLFHS